jgi:Pyruvate kinase, barrel domain
MHLRLLPPHSPLLLPLPRSLTVMLSAESAAGKYPVESVTMQQLIINKVEVKMPVTVPYLLLRYVLSRRNEGRHLLSLCPALLGALQLSQTTDSFCYSSLTT